MLNPGDPDLIASIDAHITKHVAKVDMVFHEIISLDAHIDVHQVRPGPGRPFHTLITSGMSERPMATGPEAAEFRFAEVAILLEPSWSLEHDALNNEDLYWPVRLLKTVARFPFDAETWVGAGHTIAAADPPEPFAPATKLSAAILLPAVRLGEDFVTMTRPDGATTHFWLIVPLFAEELTLKLAKGTDALIDALEAAGVDDIVRQSRPNAAARKKFLGLF